MLLLLCSSDWYIYLRVTGMGDGLNIKERICFVFCIWHDG